MSTACLCLALLLLSPAALASDAARPEDRPVGWQGANHRRGTWDIIINCLTTFIACTWSVQHLNVPAEENSQESSAEEQGGLLVHLWRAYLANTWRRMWRQLKWMIITTLFPELIVIHAYLELTMALKALWRMKGKGKSVELPWWSDWRSLSWPRGCFSTRQEETEVEKQLNTKVQAEVDKKWTLTHCFFANMGGLYYTTEKSPPSILTAVQLAEESEFEQPEISEDEIKDKSKQDLFAKIFAVFQILWLVLSIIVRKFRGLAYSQLELITLVFAVCGVCIYFLYFYKPQNVERRIRIGQKKESLKEASSRGGLQQTNSERDASSQSQKIKKTYDSLWDVLMNKSHSTSDSSHSPLIRVPNDNIPLSKSHVAHSAVVFLAFASGLFGALHAFAWDFEFPSRVERYLWRTATCVAAGSPFVGLITIPLAQLTRSAGDPEIFKAKCLRLMSEYSWHVSDKGPINAAYEKLEHTIVFPENDQQQQYVYIFSEGPESNDAQARQLAGNLLDFLELKEDFLGKKPQELHHDKELIGHFQTLVSIIEGHESKRLIDQARTDIFPQKNVFHKSFNQGIVVVTTILYCLARLSILAVGFSSLRSMPDSVYVRTPWTTFISVAGSG
ncbi:MAG: hypothetical protein M1824_004292 [Vezdaea acicularis]|nr:MAG: hypothetical protein M1824_004292 [Vezdaea acicularis]